jgi:dihydropteroate synthase
MKLDCGGRSLDLSEPVIMGILNVTPDSFSDGGRFCAPDVALEHARSMVDAGAALIDVGGESTRPGAADVPVDQELERVIPIIEQLASRVAVPISIDTSKPEVMTAALHAGAGMINDVRALREPGALAAAMDTGLPVCLMHMSGQPRSMQANPRYQDVVAEVMRFLEQRVQACVGAGIEPGRLLIDPGFGFGKSLDHNLSLLANLDRFASLELPVLVGLSRKSMFGALLGAELEQRLPASLAAALLAVQGGARIIRVHDVGATHDVLKLVRGVAKHRA